MQDINSMAPHTGRVVREDGSVANEADGINSDGSQNVKLTGSDAVGKETLSVGGSAIGLAAIPVTAKKAQITVETTSVRFWVDGSAPTTSQGHLLNAGDALTLDSRGQLTNFKAIATSGTATLQVSYF